MSGRFDLTQSINYFRDLFDGHYNDDIYFHMPRHFMANINDGELLDTIRKLDILLAVGETDPFKLANQEFSALLWAKGINHQHYTWSSFAHTPRSWKQMVRLYL